MRAQRLDLGVDVVVLPERELVVIHPDLDYGQALGAVAATLPDMHMDAVTSLVDQVTPRPRIEPPHRARSAARYAGLATVVVYLAAVLAFFIAPQQTAAAHAKFGETWLSAMHGLGLTCVDRAAGWTCLDGRAKQADVAGYARDDRTLYLVNLPDQTRHVLVFDTEQAARQWAREHPDRTVTGRVAVW